MTLPDSKRTLGTEFYLQIIDRIIATSTLSTAYASQIIYPVTKMFSDRVWRQLV